MRLPDQAPPVPIISPGGLINNEIKLFLLLSRPACFSISLAASRIPLFCATFLCRFKSLWPDDAH
jgi:hypothetical protein